MMYVVIGAADTVRRGIRGCLPQRSVLIPGVIFVVVSLSILGVSLKPGYIMTLDMVYGPQTAYRLIEHYLFGVTVNGGNAGASPTVQVAFSLVSALANLIVPMWVVQKLWLLFLLTFAGWSMYSLIPSKSGAGRLFGGFLYVVNPFVLVRLLAGHFFILWGVAFFPKVLQHTLSTVERPDNRGALKLALWLTLLAGSVHFLYLALALLTLLVAVRLAIGRSRWQLFRAYLVCMGVFAALNVGFVFSMLFETGHLVATVRESTPEVLQLFSARSSGRSLLLDLVAMYGFWHRDYDHARFQVFGWYVILGVILWLVIQGMLHGMERRSTQYIHGTLIVVGIASIVLAAGVSFAPTAGLFTVLSNSVPFFGSFRDSQKFIGVLVLIYGFYGGIGATRLFTYLTELRLRRLVPFTWGLFALLFLVVALYSYKVFPTTGGKFYTGFCPESYQAAERILVKRRAGDAVVVFPWHGYMPFRWAGGYPIANPSGQCFSGKVVYGDNVEMGPLYSTSTSPKSRYIEALLDPLLEGEEKSLGERLRPLRTSHVLLLKESDFAEYKEVLEQQRDLRRVMENDDLILYEVALKGAPYASGDEIIAEPSRWRYLGWYSFSAIFCLWVTVRLARRPRV